MKRKATNDRHVIKGVLFDLDGTLTAPGAFDFAAIKREINCPADMHVLEFIETQPVDRRAYFHAVLELKETEAAETSQPNAGAERCLSELKKRGILLGIHTRNSLKSVQQVLRKFETVAIEDFAAIMTREDCKPKPDPEGVLRVSDLMGISFEELMVVGDFRFDVIAGKNAGAATVLLTNGKTPVLAPGDPEPDHMIEHLLEILELIGNGNQVIL